MSLPSLSLRKGRAPITPTKTGHFADSALRAESIASPNAVDSSVLKHFNIGKVLGAHGVRGDVKVHLSPEYGGFHAQIGSTLYVKNATERVLCPWTVTKSRVQGCASLGVYIVRFHNINTRTAAEAFNKCNIYVEEQTIRGNLEANEYMVRDLVGLNCYHIRDIDAVAADVSAVSGQPAISPELILGAESIRHSCKMQPIARVLGVVTADELCSDPKVAHLMHAQLELQVFPALNKATTTPNRAARRKLSNLFNSTTNVLSLTSAAKRSDGLINCVLMPLVPSIVPVVDIKRGLIFLDPPEGLLDLTYKVKGKPQIDDIVSFAKERKLSQVRQQL